MALNWGAFAPPATWRRAGAEWRGPCPVTGEGHTRAWAIPDRAMLGCRHCGDGSGRLAGSDFATHAAALGVLSPDPWRPAPRAPALWPFTRHPPRPAVSPAPAPDRRDVTALTAVWNRSDPLTDTPGALYLARRVGWSGEWPAALRWLPAARFAGVRPRPPAAAGCVVYQFTPAARLEASGACGLQLEAVNGDGAAVPFDVAGKRPSVRDSRIAGAVFVARPGAPGAAVWLAESVIDALAVLALGMPHADAAVLAAGGAGGVGLAALPRGSGPVTVAAQNDPAGRAAALRIGIELEARRRVWRVRMPRGAGDWADVAREVAAERDAIRGEGADDG